MAFLPQTGASAADAEDALPLRPEDAKALLRECFAQFVPGLLNTVRVSIDTSDDLFEFEVNKYVTPEDVRDFRNKRELWLARFDKVVHELFERRISGVKRKGRRPDLDASVGSLRVLNEFDYDKQTALTRAKTKLGRSAKAELGALDVRVAALFADSANREFDNPFSPDYILDAIGMTSRELYPNPRVWRPLMERILEDVSPFITKIYISLNRFLADRQVMPEIKAELRAKSDLRPTDDKELFTLFGQLFKEVGSPGEEPPQSLPNVHVPDSFAPEPGKRPLIAPGSMPRPQPFSVPGPAAPPATHAMTMPAGTGMVAPVPGGFAMPAAGMHYAGHPMQIPPGYAMLVPIGGQGAPIAVPTSLVTGIATPTPSRAADGGPTMQEAPATDDGFAFPQLDPMMALGRSSAVFAALEQWQHYDPAGDLLHAVATASQIQASEASAAAGALPLNRIPYIRAAIADKFSNPTDKITMDVIGLLFDYIFRDPSIPESLRELFGRLQVPILKAALLDRGFFSDKRHPARRLLDRLAAAAIAATSDEAYRTAFEGVAKSVVEELCADFKIDIDVFKGADAKLQAFIESEQTRTAQSLSEEVAAALAAEEREADRAQVHIIVRDRLAALDLPAEVRSFAEHEWVDVMAAIRAEHGEDSPVWQNASDTLDDLLWSITAKERTAQKARLTKLIPKLIGNLRKSCPPPKVPPERMQSFFETLYQLHMAAIKAKPQPAAPAVAAAPAGTADTVSGAAPESAEQGSGAGATPPDEFVAEVASNVRDFVNEMVAGTWVAFNREDEIITARLFWISPLRTKYIFTSRTRGKALMVTPDELALEIDAGTASLVIEPVPLFDRAVSAALDSLAAKKVAANEETAGGTLAGAA